LDSWLIDVITATAPSAAKTILAIYERLKTMKDEDAFRIITILFLAQVIEQNNILNRKLDSANEALAVLLERTKKL